MTSGFRSLDMCLARALIQSPQRLGNRQVAYAVADADAVADMIAPVVKGDMPDASPTDIKYGLETLFESHGDLWSWHHRLLASESIGISWEDGQPRLPPSSILSWMRLANTFDEDTLLSHDFAYSFPDDQPVEWMLPNWRTIVRAGDRGLDSLLSKGVTDLHVHANGVRMPQATWLQMMARPGAHRAFSNLNAKYARRAQPVDGLSGRAQRSFSDRMGLARHLRERLIIACDLEVGGGQRPHPGDIGPFWHHWKLSAERNLLIRCWRILKAEGEMSFTLDFDQYLALKHDFFSMARQHAFAGDVGLRFFEREHFRALKRNQAEEKALPSGPAHWRSSPQHQMAPYLNAGAFLSETNNLMRGELRIAPFERAPEYWRFFTLWNRLNGKLNAWIKETGRTPPKIGFCVHFKRTRETDRSGGASTAHLRGKLDRHTAALRAALSCPLRAPRMTDLVRIDVAGNERDTASSLFGLHLRLLRGDVDAIRYCEHYCDRSAEEAEARDLKYWQRLYQQRRYRPLLSESSLGLTVHAGEDFAHPIEGLYQVAGAIESCGLQSGDSIGHGLVLSKLHSDNQRQRTGYIEMGMQFDALCWLHSIVGPSVDPTINSERSRLERMIAETGREVFGQDAATTDMEVADLIDAWRMAFNPEQYLNGSPKHHQPRGAARRLAELALLPDVLKRRERAKLPAGWGGLIASETYAREHLIREIKSRRIVIETNPSSNLRVSGSSRADQNPIIDIMSMVKDGLVASINTDNPGVFVTCIENEYAFFLASAREAGIGEGDARRLLEEMRECGASLVHWPVRTSARSTAQF